MKEGARRGLYIGIGAGLVLFAIIGLLPGSFLGGVIGLNIAGMIFGTPVTASIFPRLIVGVFMLFGVMVSGLVFVIGCGTLGWLLGTVVDHLRAEKVKEALKTNK